jgi:hypothetical protein
MEHSNGEATFSEPGVPGDLGLLARPGDLGLPAELGDLELPTGAGDLGTVPVELLRRGGGIAVCHISCPDDMALSLPD